MLVVSTESKNRLNQVRTAMENELRKEDVQLSSLAVSRTPERIERVWQRFEEKLVYLSLYGEDPRAWRVFLTISEKPHDWNYHGVSLWRYRDAGPKSPEGIPLAHDQFVYFMSGALVFSKSDDTWNLHT